jgi:SAM-dependent methyltransferase
MKKDRGIKELNDYFENFSKDIQKRIDKKGKVRILDAGCGYGLAMAGLIKKFGNNIEAIGYNLTKKDGTVSDFKKQAVKNGIFTQKEINKIKNIPKIIYINADKGLPFKKNSFDFIFSMASVYLYKDKIKFFEECNRVLKPEGIAKISLFETKNLKDKKVIFRNLRNSFSRNNLFEIWDKKAEVNFASYFDRIKGVEIKCGKREDNNHAVVYLEISKQSKLNFKLKLIDTVNMGIIAPDRYGMRSIYTTG